jgi:hypothetical protein
MIISSSSLSAHADHEPPHLYSDDPAGSVRCLSLDISLNPVNKIISASYRPHFSPKFLLLERQKKSSGAFRLICQARLICFKQQTRSLGGNPILLRYPY